jgi:glycosidase
MPSSVDEAQVRALLAQAQRGQLPQAPFPSPTDWRDVWIYFVLLDRFDRGGGQPPISTQAAPPVAWDGVWGFRQGGDLAGVRARLPYLQNLGVKAIWLSPVLKNPRPPEWAFNYHGYAAQDFLNLDERLASDGTLATAETELRALIDVAHARGIYVILDIVLNHAARVFDYRRGGASVADFQDAGVLNGPLGSEPDIEWLNGLGVARADWRNTLPPPAGLSADDAVWPIELQRADFFRRRGGKITDEVPPGAGGFVRGDFGAMRQLAVEYDADAAGDAALRRRRGRFPVLDVLIKAHLYLIARYDFDGFRIDTVKYVHPDMIETFGNAVREFALSIGKKNFFTFGEIYDQEATVAAFVGRNGGGTQDGFGAGFGIDAALDFPLFFTLPDVAKGQLPVEAIRGVFEARKRQEAALLSSHGEAGRYFVSFLDNHDQPQRIRHPDTRADQVTLAVAVMFALQGIPSLYYGTEQDLDGTHPTRPQYEGVREALWGKLDAFAQDGPTYKAIKRLAEVREEEAPLRYGRLYFRHVSGNGVDFGMPAGKNGILAFSRTLAGREVLIVANTEGNATRPEWRGRVLVDLDLNETPQTYRVAFSNKATDGTGTVAVTSNAVFWSDAGQPGAPARAASLFVALGPGEVQILVPT